MTMAVSRDTLAIRAVAVVCASLGGLGCGATTNAPPISDAAAGGQVVDHGASPGVDGAGGDSCAATCINGCCDGTGVCRNSGDTQCGFYGTACTDCTANAMTCVSGKCIGEPEALCDAGVSAAAALDAGACSVDLTRYDRSCSVDSDCVSSVEFPCAVYQGGFVPVRGVTLFVGGGVCGACNCNSGLAISRSAVGQYLADVSRTPEGSGQVAIPRCMCPPPPPPSDLLCVNGMCK